MKTFIASLLFLGVLFAQDCLDSDSTSQGTLINGQCACKAGFAPVSPSDCEDNIVSECSSSFSTVAPLSSTTIGSLTDASLSSNTITVVVENSQLFQERLVSSVSFNNPSSALCTYPGSNWVKALDGGDCLETYTGNIDWNLATDVNTGCAMVKSLDSTDDEDIYNAEIMVTVLDELESILGQEVSRTTQGSLLLEIKLPTKFTVSANVTVISQAEFSAAISAQSYDPVLEEGTIVVTTSSSAPYKVSTVTVLEYPQSVLLGEPSTSFVDASCSDENGDCTQEITVVSLPDLNPSSCSFSGTYVLGVDLACRTFPCTEISENITLSIISSELCGKIEISGTASGELDFYDTDSRDTTKGAFQEEETIFFALAVTADVAIDSLSATDVTVVLQGTSDQAQLVVGGSLTGVGTNVNFAQNYNSISEALDFEFDLIFGVSGLGFDMPQDGVALLSVIVDSEIVYSNGISKKRADLSTSSQLQFSRSVPVFKAQLEQGEVNINQQTAVTSNVSVVTIVGCVGFIVIAAIKLRKRF